MDPSVQLPSVKSFPLPATLNYAVQAPPLGTRWVVSAVPDSDAGEYTFAEPATPFPDEELAARLLYSCAGVVDDEHGHETPKRFVAMLRELTQCAPAHDALVCTKWKTFAAQSADMIIVRDIPFTSVCNHHVLPFFGKVHIAYVPQDVMAGLSKFSRAVKHFASKPQVQERMTMELGDFLEHNLKPRGVGIIVQAEHMCMTIRGAQAPGTLTLTNTMRGVFGDHTRTAKAEFTAMLNGGHK